ncbi:hypothetical protein PM10SUCC1_03400 [Propionigenium maris DSM 9537]|uniref:Uncharacterized protein n=1 Tax=Propionigenium maris DSM 9537 TaxID=1123000 RepID=A0A9W6GIY7_9FUSO|nr:hypothetical protein PM10SUCC1_03400 [Propionigenium maris DSM 9537]
MIFFSVNPSFAGAQDKGEIVKAEIIVEAEIISTFKTERKEISRTKESKQVDKEMNATVLERIDEESNIRTFIFE